MAMKKINILGTEYTVLEKDESEDELLKKCDGYCDKTTKEIVVMKLSSENCELHNPEWYRKKVIRHEIVHAFMFESGLHECMNKNEGTHDEQMVDWIAIQFPKIQKVFVELGCDR